MHKALYSRMLQITLTLSLLLVAGSLHAQISAGGISGTATDPTGAAIPGATATIANQETGVSRILTAGDSGFYSAEGLFVGSSRIRVSRMPTLRKMLPETYRSVQGSAARIT